MDNKTKVKVAVVIGIVILAIIFIFMVVFVKGNRTPVNKNIPTKGEEGYVDPTQNDNDDSDNDNGNSLTLEDVVSLGVENGNLVKIYSNLSSSVIKKLESGYVELCYGDNKVYTVIDNRDGTNSVIEIDLSNNTYPEKTLFTTEEYGNISNIEYYGEKLYFVSEKGQLVEYSISESFGRGITKENEVSSFVINPKNNSIILSYQPNRQNPGIYVLDFTSNNLNQIISLNELAGKLFLEGKTLVIDVKEFNKLYAYDMEQNTIAEVGDDNSLKLSKNHIAFYNDLLLYANANKIDIKDASGNVYRNDWYTLNDQSIAAIAMLNSSQLQIARVDENGSGNVTRSIIIDLTNGTTTEIPEGVYSEIIRIK